MEEIYGYKEEKMKKYTDGDKRIASDYIWYLCDDCKWKIRLTTSDDPICPRCNSKNLLTKKQWTIKYKPSYYSSPCEICSNKASLHCSSCIYDPKRVNYFKDERKEIWSHFGECDYCKHNTSPNNSYCYDCRCSSLYIPNNGWEPKDEG